MTVLLSLSIHSLSCGWPRGSQTYHVQPLTHISPISLPCPLSSVSPYVAVQASICDLHFLSSLPLCPLQSIPIFLSLILISLASSLDLCLYQCFSYSSGHDNSQLTASPTILHFYLSRKAQVSHHSGYQKPTCGITRGSEERTYEQAACKTV